MADTDPAATQDTQDGADFLAGVPENYRRPTVEETAQVLLESQKAAQREMVEATTARRILEQRVAEQQSQIEQYEAQQAQQAEPDQSEWYAAYEQDPIATFRAMSEQAADARFKPYAQQAAEQLQAVQESQAKFVADNAWETVRDRYDIDEEQSRAMVDVVKANPYLIPAHATFDQNVMVGALENLYKIAVPAPQSASSQADLQRTMKLQAQSATGAGGHLEPADQAAQRWQEIQNAPTTTLGL